MANESRTPGMLGRLSPHPAQTHPRLTVEDYIDFSALPAPPALIDWCSKVTTWPMYLNDQLGDCTCATVGHEIQAFSAYGNTEVTVTDNDVLALYEAVGGYVPGDPSTDNGCVIQDILAYWAANPVGGHEIYAYAQIQDLTNLTQVAQILDLFGTVYLGINVPQSAMTQFNAGQPWSNVGDTDILGGHAIPVQKMTSANTDNPVMDVITWGAVQEMELSFWQAYVEEAWIVVSQQDWLNAATGESPDGLDLTQLMADFKDLGGSDEEHK